MKTIWLLLLLFFVCTTQTRARDTAAEDIETVDGGIGIHVSNNLLEHLKLDLLQQIFDKIIDLPIPDQSFEKELIKGFTAAGSLSNVKLNNLGWDLSLSDLKFESAFPNILFKLTNFAMDLTFDYSLTTVPAIYKDIGNATVNFFPFNVTFGMTTHVVNGMVQVEILDFSYGFDDYSIKFSGNGDISFLIVTIADAFKEVIKSDLSPNILTIMELVVQPEINKLLSEIPTAIDMFNMTLDYRIMDYGQYSDLDFNIVSKGEVRPVDESSLPFQTDRKVPKNFNTTGGDIQVFVADYFIRSLLYSVYKTGLVTVRITDNPLSPGSPFKVGDVAIIFPALSKTYAKTVPVYFDIQTTRGFDPVFKVSNGETYLTLQIDLGMGANPQEGTYKTVFRLLTQIDMTLDFGLVNGTSIAASITTFKFKVVGVEYDTIDLKPADINSMLGLVTGLVRNYVNYALGELEIPLPEIPLISIDLNKTYIYEMDRYLLFQTSPRFKLKARRVFVPTPIDRSLCLRNRISTHEGKVEIFKRLIKITPIMGILEEAKKMNQAYKLPREVTGFGKHNFDEDGNEDKPETVVIE